MPKSDKQKIPKIAIVADWLYGGGAEKVVQALHQIYPEAPIYTSYCSDEWRKKLDNKVVTGYLQHPPFKQLRKFLPVLRLRWFKKLDLSAYDIVISSSGNGESKFIDVPNGLHICYCHTPNHFYWRHFDSYYKNPGFRPKWLARLGLMLMINPLGKRDFHAAQKVDKFIANSTHIRSDIKLFYKKDSVVIYPPVDISRFDKTKLAKQRRGFVTVGRQVPMKKLDIIIRACNELGLPLTVIGNGPIHKDLEQMAGPTITFKTNLTDAELPLEIAKAEAFVFASFEDFGIAPVEAMSIGLPVIAYKAGGALDYVIPNKTGEFFTQQSVKSLKEALTKFDYKKYDPKYIKSVAKKFSIDNFKRDIKKLISEEFQKNV